jgi:hypothetical protein
MMFLLVQLGCLLTLSLSPSGTTPRMDLVFNHQDTKTQRNKAQSKGKSAFGVFPFLRHLGALVPLW